MAKETKHTSTELRELQALPLEVKIEKTKLRIKEFVHHFGEDHCYVSFSGGKDSTVLLDIARSVFPNIKALFINTGLEYPEIQSFVKTIDNVETIRPKKKFNEIIRDYGYPVVSKEISEVIRGGRIARETNRAKYGYYLDRLEGKKLDKNGEKSPYNCEQWHFY